MKHYLLPLATVIFSIFLTSCGEDNSILGLGDVQKSDLTTPLFLAADNTLGDDTKEIWAFNDTEAVKGTITVVGDNTLRFHSDWFFNTWSYSNKTLTLGQDQNRQTYNLKKVSVLGYNAIVFAEGTKIYYTCIPSSNWSLNGKHVEDDWYSRGLTKEKFWNAFRESNTDKKSVEVTLNN